MKHPFLIDINILKMAAQAVRKKFPSANPFAAFVLGSGWSDAIKVFNIKEEIAYNKIPGFGETGVAGHVGKLSLVEFNGREFFVFQGRRHYYEGEGWTPVVLPAYIAKECGASILFLSNAAGGISHKPGELMIITDHINNMGSNPLIGPHHQELGPRFPDMSSIYDKDLIKRMEAAGEKVGVTLSKGTYIACAGPNYETPSEIKYFKQIGASAVGMSTVPEAMIANSMGMKVAGLSCITNYAAGIGDKPLTHEEVTETLSSVMENIHKLIPEIIKAFLATTR